MLAWWVGIRYGVAPVLGGAKTWLWRSIGGFAACLAGRGIARCLAYCRQVLAHAYPEGHHGAVFPKFVLGDRLGTTLFGGRWFRPFEESGGQFGPHFPAAFKT